MLSGEQTSQPQAIAILPDKNSNLNSAEGVYAQPVLPTPVHAAGEHSAPVHTPFPAENQI